MQIAILVKCGIVEIDCRWESAGPRFTNIQKFRNILKEFHMENIKTNFKVVRMPSQHKPNTMEYDMEDVRFQIIDSTTGEVIDNAQGWGYKTVDSANKFLWYKYKGGRAKIDAGKKAALNFWKKNPVVRKAVSDALEYNFKELARGENTVEELLMELETEYDVSIKKEYLKYL